MTLENKLKLKQVFIGDENCEHKTYCRKKYFKECDKVYDSCQLARYYDKWGNWDLKEGFKINGDKFAK